MLMPVHFVVDIPLWHMLSKATIRMFYARQQDTLSELFQS